VRRPVAAFDLVLQYLNQKPRQVAALQIASPLLVCRLLGSEHPACYPFLCMSAKVTAIIYILICFEVGILLIILPWTPYWDDNFFLNYITGKLQMTGLATFLQTGYVRGAVSALGIVNILAGLRDMFRFRESVHAIAALDSPS
jgi:hypothetical protein